MRRREFISLLGGAAAAWPLATRAQQPAMSLVGLIIGGSPESFAPNLAALRQGLQEAGFVEGRNAAIEARWARGQFDRMPGLVADLVGRGAAVVVTQTLPGALAAKAATERIPVVFVIGEDPVEAGLVHTLNRPGGNITGLSHFMNLISAKRLDQLVVLAARHHVPASYPLRYFVAAGGLMSYDANYADTWRRAGIYAGRILKGDKPGTCRCCSRRVSIW